MPVPCFVKTNTDAASRSTSILTYTVPSVIKKIPIENHFVSED
jgi:hypothetical protein